MRLDYYAREAPCDKTLHLSYTYLTQKPADLPDILATFIGRPAAANQIRSALVHRVRTAPAAAAAASNGSRPGRALVDASRFVPKRVPLCKQLNVAGAECSGLLAQKATEMVADKICPYVRCMLDEPLPGSPSYSSSLCASVSSGGMRRRLAARRRHSRATATPTDAAAIDRHS